MTRTTKTVPATTAKTLLAALDRLPLAFALFDAKRRLAAWNAPLAALGLFPKSLIEQGATLAQFQRHDAGLKRSVARPHEVRLLDGKVLLATRKRVPPGQLLITYEDVTEARLAALRYDLAMRGINEGVYDWDIAKGTAYYSEGVYRATGMTPREIRSGRDWRDRIHADDLPKYDAALIAHFKGEAERFQCDYRFRAKDGSWRWARQHGVAIRDTRGRAVRMVGSTGDINELKRIEQALKESQERLALATQAATEGIYEWDVATGSLYLSDRAKTYFAVKGSKLTPRAWNALLHKEDFAGYRAAIASFFKSRRTQFEHEYRLRKAGGGQTWVLDRAVAVRDAQARVTRVVGAITDITQRKLAELELRRARDEATEALERQTATAEILSVIAGTPSDVQPVLEAIVRTAARLCEAQHAVFYRLHADGYRPEAAHNVGKEYLAYRNLNPIPVSSKQVMGRVALARKPVHVLDVLADPAYQGAAAQRLAEYRTVLGVPVIREGRLLGNLAVFRTEVRAFSTQQVALLQTFADQAVIAIENVRLFNETREALERQTATAEVLKVIASSPNDVQPVFDAIASSALRLLGGLSSVVTRVVGDMVHLSAFTATDQAGMDLLKSFYPQPLSSVKSVATVLRTGKPLYRSDAQSDPESSAESKELARVRGYRSILWVPLLREGVAFGAIHVSRAEAGPFSDHQIKLLETFADQAVIAIENVRLFNETREALERQTATGEILNVIAGSPADVQPVFDAIVQSAARLFDRKAALRLVEPDGLRRRAWSYTMGDEFHGAELIPMDRGSLVGSAALECKALQFSDSQGADSFPYSRAHADQLSYRAAACAPLVSDGAAIGVITVTSPNPGAMSDKQMALLKTFADQAVIAIQNVRLFNETREALERQTATAEILKVIASSPSDVQPVFDAIAESALRLVGGLGATVTRVAGDALHLAALTSTTESGNDAVRAVFPSPLSTASILAEAVRTAAPAIRIDTQNDPGVPDEFRRAARARGFRSIVAVPMVREGASIGTISVTRREAGQFSEHHVELLRTFADQAVIAIENVRLFNETKESLERQTATAEILKVIASSPSDVQPVFESIAERSTMLCSARNSFVTSFDGELIHMRAHHGPSWDLLEEVHTSAYPMKPGAGTMASRAVLQSVPIQIPDIQADPDYEHKDQAQKAGFRSGMSVPMLREGKVIGAITVAREEAGAFPQHQVELLKTFADQAVIAIENVRLFNETKEALERQTATADVLASISGSMTNTQPVFDAIVRNINRLFGTRFAVLQLLRDGRVEMPAVDGAPGFERLRERYPRPLDDTTVGGLTMLSKQTVRYAPVIGNPSAPPATVQFAKDFGFDSVIFTPMICEGKVIGAIGTALPEPRPFDERQVALIKTFADQAVIAIENARLFNETREALERQTATAEILKVIASSPSDVQPVFDAIADSARRLLDARAALVARRAGDKLELAAFTSTGEAADAALRALWPSPITGKGHMGQAILNAAPVLVSDIENDMSYSEAFRASARVRGVRSVVSVPMLREGEPIGVISVNRPVAGNFSDHQTNLLRTFADQAVIAIENVRLFNETQEALERQTATAEILNVIASSPSDVQPVFDAIAKSAYRLIGGFSTAVARVFDGVLQLVAFSSTDEAGNEALKHAFPMPVSRSKAARTGEPVSISDTEALPDSASAMRELARTRGFRSILIVPMLREAAAIGTISVTRREPAEFSNHQVELLKTFADQAVIAIENVRLFNETREALERQTATAEILKVISSSPTDTQPVFDAIVQSGLKLFAGAGVGISIVEGSDLRIVAATGNLGAAAMGMRLPISLESASGMAIVEQCVVNIKDTEAPDVPPHARDNGRKLGIRSMTQAPMFRDGEPVGAIGVTRKDPGGLDDKQVTLLKTFADQAVIAIENVRLFKELQSRTDALTKSVGQLTALGEVGQAISSTLDLETVLQTIVSHAVKLTGLDAGGIYEYDAQSELFTLRAAQNMGEEILEFLRSNPIRKGEGAVGGTAVTREPVQVTETLDDSYQSRLREIMVRAGRRAILAVPLLREDHIIGALAVQKTTPGAFAPEVVELLKTFATQSAMAIQNARLFREIAEKGKQLEQASQHKSNFLASMSHELRTPLNAILGFNEMILGQVYGEVPTDMQEPLADIQTSGKHLLRLINNVLDLAKIEAGRMELSLQDYSVHDTVGSVHSTLRPLAAEKGLEFLATLPDDLPLAYGDGGRITQCLMNLAGNSIKFTKAGKVEISVEEKDGLLTYRVSDTGIGIPPDKIDSLFTEFKQTDATIASEYGGTGLGLSISKKFVEMHGGRIWIESELGKGSVFIIEVPLRVTAP